jgi:hypothetical protein
MEKEHLVKPIQEMLETGEHYYLSPYCDVETGQFNGTFTAEQLRAIADAMDKLKPKQSQHLQSTAKS